MAYEHREGSGSLFPNTYKEKDTQPDYKGDIMLNGELMSIAGWSKPGKNGEFISVKISPKIAVKASDSPSYQTPRQNSPMPESDPDDLPF